MVLGGALLLDYTGIWGGKNEPLWAYFAGVGFVVFYLLMYLQQYLEIAHKYGDEAAEYTSVIAQIETIGKQLSTLSKFLERERTKVADAEGAIKRLESEKASLDPVVAAQRQTVEAVLGAYARRNAANVWKERAIGFVLGLTASIVAAMIGGLFSIH